ncbi:MAG: pyrroloquinoline quinone biosynthesis peptide chaperone PqqD [Pseudomonadota bacterium]
MTLDPNALIGFSPLHRLQWEEAQQKNVILYPEGMVELNDSSAEILKLCDGTRNVDKIVTELEQKFDVTGLKEDIAEFLDIALENGWIRQSSDQ